MSENVSFRPDWSDFGYMSIIWTDKYNGSTLYVVETDINKNKEYPWYQQHYDEAMKREGSDKIFGTNNGTISIVERKGTGFSVRIGSLTGMSKIQQDDFFSSLKQQGFKETSINVLHSSDGGAWISKAPKFGEKNGEYEQRRRMEIDADRKRV